jgi:hypothetical protein
MNDGFVPGRQLKSPQVRLMTAAWAGISALVAMCILLAGNFSDSDGVDAEQELQPTPSVSPVAGVSSPAGVDDFGYGIQVHVESGNPDPTFATIDQLGLDWVKQQVRWASMQPTPDEIQWEWLDSFMAQASGSDIKVMLSIVTAPDWARSSTSSDRTGPPDNFQDYADFVAAVLERYPGQIHAIEVWNEQNLQREWYSVGGLSAERYAEMLSLTYDTIKAINPNIIVVSGALSPTGVNDGIVAIDDFEYLDQMIAAGALSYVDCIGAHHGGVNLPPDLTAEEAFEGGMPEGTVFLGPYDPENPLNPHHSWSFRSTLRGQYDKIVAAGGTQKLCVTEFGWASMEGLGIDETLPDFEFAWDNSAAEQAAYIVQGYQLLREWGIAQMAFVWNLNFATEDEVPMSDNELYSIIAPDGTPRQAFHAIAAMPKD